MLRQTIILVGFAALATGCSTISEESCIAGSWESLGYEDGRDGETRGHFNKIAESCAKYGIQANATEYRLGYETGLQQYCSYDRGYDNGTSGKAIKSLCREINSIAYLDGYTVGLPLYCTFDRGFDHAVSGKSVNAQCGKINSISYLDGHEEGVIEFALKQEYEDMIDVYDDTRAALEDVVYRLSNFDLDDRNRIRLQTNRRRLERELDDIRIDVRAFERVQNWPKVQLTPPNFDRVP